MIFHIAAESEWDGAGSYRPDSLEVEGFIHCSSISQVDGVANERFAGRHDLVIVTIDPDQLDAPVVWEDCYETGTRFPHVYGMLEADAVVDVAPFRPDGDGRFRFTG